MNLRITLLNLAFMMCLASMTKAQTSTSGSSYGLPKGKDFDRFSIGISVGPNAFQGDIQKKKGNEDRITNFPINLSYGLAFNYQASHSIGLRLRGMMGQFTGEDYYSVDVNGRIDGMPGFNSKNLIDPNNLTLNKFKGQYIEGSLDMVYTFGNISYLKRNKKFRQ